MAKMDGIALQQQRHSEHLAEQLKQREVELKAKQLELAQEVLGRKLAESQQAQAENSARQEALKAQQALEVSVPQHPYWSSPALPSFCTRHSPAIRVKHNNGTSFLCMSAERQGSACEVSLA